MKTKLNPTDTGRKVTCKIKGTQVDDGELYYCTEKGMYFILQNENNGASPQSISPEEKGYKYSWFYHDPLDNNWLDSSVTEFDFKEENIVNERLFNRKAEFTEYLHKIFEIINTEEGNRRAILLYKLLSDVRGIGYDEGKRAEKEELLKFLNSR